VETVTLRFGAWLPQGWHAELKHIDDPVRKYEILTQTALEAESAAFDSIWLVDHLHTAPSTPVDDIFECWTALAGLARDTHRVRLGQLVTCNSFRHPALLAKMAACVDVMSHGRLILGIGAGWYSDEYEANGLPFPGTLERLRMMGESVALIKQLWTTTEPVFSGQYYSVRAPQNFPRPLQQPHPPIWIGGMGEKVTLRLVAELGDACNLHGSPDMVAKALLVLKDHCRAVGRDYESVAKTAFLTVILGDDREINRVKAQIVQRIGSLDAGIDGELVVGNAESVANSLRAYMQLGIADFVVRIPHGWEGGHYARFGETVVPLVS
jgi:F420-dependent oxidoreductase-like protein